jgi:hypothetical protein
MNRFAKIIFVLGAAILSSQAQLFACAACYGASDSPLAKGMNWGIFSLLGVVVCVLGTFATFFVYLAKKSATPPAETAAEISNESHPKL